MRVDDGAVAPLPQPGQPTADPAPGPRARSRRLAWRPTPEQLAVLALSLLVLAVHDVGYLLSHSYWADESWVAVTTRFPLSALPATTSSSPIGWTFLVRLTTIPRTQSARLMPLAFAAASVVVAYWLARRLAWRWQAASVAAGLAAALAALAAPTMLVRNDLKQYTAEVFTSLLTLLLTSRLEQRWSRRGLVALSLSVWVGMLFSNAVAFFGVTTFAGLFLVQLARRDWRRLAETAAAGAATAVLMVGVYAVFDAPAVAALKTSPYWPHFFMPLGKGLRASALFVLKRFDSAHAYFGLGPVWLAVPLVVAGIATIARLGKPATAVAVAAVWPELLILSALKKYPFLNPRTSTYLFVVTTVIAAVGLIGVASLLRPWLKGLLAAGLAVAGSALFVASALPIQRHTLPNEDVAGETAYVAAHSSARDRIVVDVASNWGFAYYWPVGTPSRRRDVYDRQQYEAYFPRQPRIIVVRRRTFGSVDTALSQAVAQARRHGCARVWLVRSHMDSADVSAWRAALARQGQSLVPVGSTGLSVIHVSGHGCP